MKTWKTRGIALLLALSLVFLLAGCGMAEDILSELIEEEESALTASERDDPVSESADPAEEAEPEETESEAPPEETGEESAPAESASESAEETPDEPAVSEDGTYDTKEEVALYIHLYGHLPSNYITKKEAEALGWTGGSLEPYAPGKSIGGSRFGNYEGLLPEKAGRKYTECDIGTKGKKSRGAKRIVYSNDGLIYYTDDHYESFTLLYGEAGE